MGFIAAQNFGCAAYKKKFAGKGRPLTRCVDLVQKSREFTWERRYFESLDLLDEAAGQCGDSVEIHLIRGNIFYTLESWQEARGEYEAVIALAPRNPEARARLWFIDALEAGFDKVAMETLKNRALEYLAIDPEDQELIYAAVLGLDGAKAVPEKTEVIEASSRFVENPDWRGDMAAIYFYDSYRTGDEELPKRAGFFSKTFPNQRLRYSMAAKLLTCLVKSGPEAVQPAVKEILKGERRNRVLNYLCAKAILDVNGDLDLAAKFIKRALKAARKPDPKDRYPFVDDKTWNRLMARTRAEYHAVYGRIKFLQGHNQEAFEEFSVGLAHDTPSKNLHMWYAVALEQEGSRDRALKHYRTAAELGDAEDAVDGIKRLLEFEGIDVDPAEHFAMTEGIPRFTDVTEEACLQQCTGSRAAWSDIDKDGFPDLVIAGRYIFLNHGDGTFVDVTEQSGVCHEYASGGILADYDNNGRPDLLAFTRRDGPRLYLNRTEQGGPVLMEDATDISLPPWPYHGGPTEAAASADINGDGTVDIYLANYEKRSPERAICAPDRLYLNRGDGTFADETCRIVYSSQENMCGRGASFSDFNGDGRQDLFVANYRLDPDFLLVNEPDDGTTGFRLVDRADAFRVRGRNVMGSYGHSIGCAWGYLGKGRPALFVAALAHPQLLGLSDTSALYLPSEEDAGFDHHFEDMGFAYQETHSDPSFVDVDLDGDLDLFITCVYAGAPSFLYLNQDGKFIDATWLAGVRVQNGWGAAWADYDKDGDMDLVVCSENMPRLFKNESERFQRNWMEVRAVGTHSPRTGTGAKVTVQTLDGESSWVREIRAGRGTGNQDEALAHFGFGGNQGPFIVTVHFPSGTEVVLDEVACCQILEVVEPFQETIDDAGF